MQAQGLRICGLSMSSGSGCALPQAYAEENGLFFWETSAKSNSNVAELFTDIAARLPRAAAPAAAPLGGITLTDAAPERAKKSTCC